MINLSSFVDEFVKLSKEGNTADEWEPTPHPVTHVLPKGSKASRVFDDTPVGRIMGNALGGTAAGLAVGLFTGIAEKKPKYILEGAATGALVGSALGGIKESLYHTKQRLSEKEKVAISLNEVQLVKRQPETPYGKLREGVVGATKGALAGSGVAALMKRSPRIGAGIGAGAYLLDRNIYGEGEKLASIGLPTNSLAFTPAKARAAKQFTAGLQPHTMPQLPPSHMLGGKSGKLRMSSGPKVMGPAAGNVV